MFSCIVKVNKYARKRQVLLSKSKLIFRTIKTLFFWKFGTEKSEITVIYLSLGSGCIWGNIITGVEVISWLITTTVSSKVVNFKQEQ